MGKAITIPEEPLLKTIHTPIYIYDGGLLSATISQEASTDLYVVDARVCKDGETPIITRNVERQYSDCFKEIRRKMLIHFCKIHEEFYEPE